MSTETPQLGPYNTVEQYRAWLGYLAEETRQGRRTEAELIQTIAEKLACKDERASLYRGEKYTDPVTKIPNRLAMDHYLAKLTERETPFGILFMDCDNFKQVNDDHSHATGDEVLKTLASTLRSGVTSFDNSELFRYGNGDEFVALLPFITTEEQVQSIAEQIMTRVSEPLFVTTNEGALHFHTTISIGGSLHHSGAVVGDSLAHADAALNQAKRNGKNQFVMSPSSLTLN